MVLVPVERFGVVSSSRFVRKCVLQVEIKPFFVLCYHISLQQIPKLLVSGKKLDFFLDSIEC